MQQHAVDLALEHAGAHEIEEALDEHLAARRGGRYRMASHRAFERRRWTARIEPRDDGREKSALSL